MDVKYDEELVKDIQEIFIHKIVPDNFILVIHKYNRKVLTFEDIERLRKSISSRASKEVNYDLLLTMAKYTGWFEVIVQVCDDPDVKQDDLAKAFKAIKKTLDERWAREHTQKKEIAMGLSKLSLTSERNQRTANVFETDDGAMCMSSESKWQEDKNSNQLSKDNDSRSTHSSSWVGVIRKDDKPYCTVCLTPLTSDKAADDHCRGKPHQKKLKEAGLVRHDGPSSGDTKAISSGTGVFKETPASSSVTKAMSSSSDAIKATPTCSGATKAILVSPNSSHTFDKSTNQASGSDKEYIVEDGNGKLKCRLCDVPVTSGDNAAQHLQGRSHKKKLDALKAQDDLNETPPELGPNGEIITYGEPTGKCYVCNTPINSKESAKQHREGRKHINRCKKFNLPEMCPASLL